MDTKQFEILVAEEFPKAIPEKFRTKIRNVAFFVESEPSPEVRRSERLAGNETLLGLYHGIPLTERGESYGVGTVMPDSITLFQFPTEAQARATGKDIRHIVRDTIWHEVAHHFGLNEGAVTKRERERVHLGIQ